MALKRSIPMRNRLLDSDSFKSLFDQGVLVLFSGTTPTASGSTPAASVAVGSSDKALLVVTNNAASYSAASNGLLFASTATSGFITKDTAQTWQGAGKSSGSVSYFRFYSNKSSAATNIVAQIGASGAIASTGVTAGQPCFQGTCGQTGDLQMVDTGITMGATSTIDQFKLTLPE